MSAFAATMEDFEALLNESFELETPDEGSVVKGIVLAIEAGQAIIDIGYKMEGRVDLKEFAAPGKNPEIKVGDTVEVYLDRVENAKGEAVHEESDRDYDGKIDSWITFVDGAMVELDEDTNKDGKPDFWKFYVNGVLNRSKRDTNFDGNADVWEIYTASGRLERSGVDDNFDGHVDRWDRDLAVIAAQEDAAKKAQEAMDAAKNGAAADAGGCAVAAG